MDIKQWCQLSKEGWILSPGESEHDFFERKKAFEKADISRREPEGLPLYDVFIKDIPVLYDRKSLFPWQGAVLWEYKTENGDRYPVIQLRKKRLKGYQQEEIMSHEVVHAVRFGFQEPLFEEVFAYKVSKSRFRRFLGPLFIYPIEATIFTGACVASFPLSLLGMTPYSLILSLGIFAFFFLRLLFLQGTFFLAKKKLKMAGVMSTRILPMMFRLSDREIMQIAWSSFQKIRSFFLEKRQKDLRLQIIVELYFSL